MKSCKKNCKRWKELIPIAVIIIITTGIFIKVSNANNLLDEQTSIIVRDTTTLMVSEKYDWNDIQNRIEDIYTEAESKKTKNEYLATIITAALGFITVLSTIIFNPKLAAYQKENLAQHEELKHQLKITWIKQTLETSLQAIVDHSLEVVPEELRNIILDRSSLFMDFARSIISSKFDASILNQIEIKLQYIADTPLDSVDVLGEEFVTKFKKTDEEHFKVLFEKMKSIVHESHFNSKNDQFRIACETFLYEKLNALVRIYKETHGQH